MFKRLRSIYLFMRKRKELFLGIVNNHKFNKLCDVFRVDKESRNYIICCVLSGKYITFVIDENLVPPGFYSMCISEKLDKEKEKIIWDMVQNNELEIQCVC